MAASLSVGLAAPALATTPSPAASVTTLPPQKLPGAPLGFGDLTMALSGPCSWIAFVDNQWNGQPVQNQTDCSTAGTFWNGVPCSTTLPTTVQDEPKCLGTGSIGLATGVPIYAVASPSLEMPVSCVFSYNPPSDYESGASGQVLPSSTNDNDADGSTGTIEGNETLCQVQPQELVGNTWQDLGPGLLMNAAITCTIGTNCNQKTLKVVTNYLSINLDKPAEVVRLQYQWWVVQNGNNDGSNVFDGPSNTIEPIGYNFCVANPSQCKNSGVPSATAAMGFALEPAGLFQMNVLPYKILYQPPGDDSVAALTVSQGQSSSTSLSLGSSKSSTQATSTSLQTTFGLNAGITSIFSLSGSYTNTWEHSTSATTTTANSQTNTLTWTQTQSQTWQSSTGSPIDNPALLNPANPPWYYDEFVLAVNPQFAFWVMPDGSVQYEMLGTDSSQYDVQAQDLLACVNQDIPYQLPGLFDVNGFPVTLAPADCQALLNLDPFYANGQSANPAQVLGGVVPQQEVSFATGAPGQGTNGAVTFDWSQASQASYSSSSTTSYSSTVTNVEANSVSVSANLSIPIRFFTIGASASATLTTKQTNSTTVETDYGSAVNNSTWNGSDVNVSLSDSNNPIETTVWLDSRWDTLMFQVPKPVITSFTPNSASSTGTTTVTINGSNFLSGPIAVQFCPVSAAGGVSSSRCVQGSNVQVVGDGTVTVTAPGFAPGTQVVPEVVGPGGTSADLSVSGQLATITYYLGQPVVQGIAPSSAPAGTTVEITGLGFTPAATVSFGGTAASSLTYVSSTELKAVAPPGSGSVDVTVKTSAGISATGPQDVFTYGIGAPGAPDAVSATAGNAQASVHWQAPSSTGGSAITQYTVTSDPGGFKATVASGTQATVTGLTNGTSYTFTVTATNASGTGPQSPPSNPVTPEPYPAGSTVPGAPTDVIAQTQGQSATVQWSPPLSTGGAPVQNYTVQSEPGGITVIAPAGVGSQESTVTGLTYGTTYRFSVTAANAVGAGASTLSNPVTPEPYPSGATVPGLPTHILAQAGNGEATVTWVAPSSDGGVPVTSYQILSNPGDNTATVAGDVYAATVTGLTNGTQYSFNVTAVNGVGAGPAGTSNTVRPEPYNPAAGLPGQPTGVVAKPGNGSATVSWQPDSQSGGSPILHYTVTSIPSGFTSTVAGSVYSGQVNGLTNGQPYQFTVTAINAVGPSIASEPTNSVTPEPYPVGATVPGAPSHLLAAAGNGQVTLTWQAPSVDGGAPLTGYTVEIDDTTTNTTTTQFVAGGGTTSTTITGLSNGDTYTFTVEAMNAVGTSTASAPSNPVIPAVGAAPPTITGFTPASGGALGGTLVTITGSGFNGSTQVLFGTTPATQVAVVSSTEVQAVAPPGSGTVNLTVETDEGLAVSSGAFTYESESLAMARTLFPGWNTLSTPFVAQQETLDQALSDGGQSLLAAYAFSQGNWVPLSGQETAGFLQAPMTAIFLYIGGSAPVTVTLTPAAPSSATPGIPPSVALAEGWNLVGPAATTGSETLRAFLGDQGESALPLWIDPNQGDSNGGGDLAVSSPGLDSTHVVVNGYGYWLMAGQPDVTIGGDLLGVKSNPPAAK